MRTALIFGRDPALILAFVAGFIQVVSSFIFPLSGEAQSLLNGAVVAAAGLWTAWKVARDKLVPAILGFAQAGLSLAVGFGLNVDAEQQSVLMSFIAVAVGMFARTQVTAKIDENGARRVPLEGPRRPVA